MRKYALASIGVLALTGSAAFGFGWHTRIANQTDSIITVKVDVMWDLSSRENFYAIKPNDTFDIERGAGCLKKITVYAGGTEEVVSILKPYLQKGLEAAKAVAEWYTESSLIAWYTGDVLTKYGGQIEAEFKKAYPPSHTATYTVPLLANRCQHWDFHIFMSKGKLKMTKQGHVLWGGTWYHPEEKKDK